MWPRVLGFLGALLVATAAWAIEGAAPTQYGLSQNQEVTSPANALIAATFTAVNNQRVRLYSVAARCSAGFASVTVTDGGTTVWSSDASFVSTNTKNQAWGVPLTGGLSNALVVSLSACGLGGSVGTMAVQWDRY